MDVMKARFELIEKIKHQAESQLGTLTGDSTKYKPLLKQLILQGLIKLLEKEVEIKCLEKDVSIVKEAISESEREFHGACDIKSKITLNQRQFLPADSVGGIILTSMYGRIVCDNTLKARLEYASQNLLPGIRSTLFTQKEGGAKDGSLI